MKGGYDVESYAEAFDAHNEFTGAVHPEGLAAEFRGICEDADAEIAALKSALSEALDSLDLATADCILMALASKRALAKFKDSDDEPCRWCGSEEDIHEEHCPAHVLVDIGFVGLIGDEVMRRSMERFVDEEDRKFHALEQGA